MKLRSHMMPIQRVRFFSRKAVAWRTRRCTNDDRGCRRRTRKIRQRRCHVRLLLHGRVWPCFADHLGNRHHLADDMTDSQDVEGS